MFNNKLIKKVLFLLVFLQAFNLMLVVVNIIANPVYQPSLWSYLSALIGSTFFGALILLKSSNKKQLIELFFACNTRPED